MTVDITSTRGSCLLNFRSMFSVESNYTVFLLIITTRGGRSELSLGWMAARLLGLRTTPRRSPASPWLTDWMTGCPDSCGETMTGIIWNEPVIPRSCSSHKLSAFMQKRAWIQNYCRMCLSACDCSLPVCLSVPLRSVYSLGELNFFACMAEWKLSSSSSLAHVAGQQLCIPTNHDYGNNHSVWLTLRLHCTGWLTLGTRISRTQIEVQRTIDQHQKDHWNHTKCLESDCN